MDSISETDESLVTRARGGDMDALDTLVRRHQSWIFNLALRMVWRRAVAEDATQEILIKAVTKLSTFAGNSAFRTWLYRLAVNHLLNVRKSEMEEQKMTFTDMGASLDGVPDEELPDQRSLPVETAVLVEEAKLGILGGSLISAVLGYAILRWASRSANPSSPRADRPRDPDTRLPPGH